jgi:RecA-family ATPase
VVFRESRHHVLSNRLISKLKSLAEKLRICLLLVHHTRKQQAEDRFDMISGTNGLLGCADGALILQKEFRTAKTATLDISGRDQQDQRLYLSRDEQTLAWNLERQETELWNAPPDPVLSAVASLVTPENEKWCGSSTELAAALGTEMKPNALSMRLNIRAAKLEQDYHIRYEAIRTHAGRQIILTYLR